MALFTLKTMHKDKKHINKEKIATIDFFFIFKKIDKMDFYKVVKTELKKKYHKK